MESFCGKSNAYFSEKLRGRKISSIEIWVKNLKSKKDKSVALKVIWLEKHICMNSLTQDESIGMLYVIFGWMNKWSIQPGLTC